jgi:predicted Zn-ribbon and HTH transcriptional regulator
MAMYKCTECGYEYEDEIHEAPEKCPFCKATTEDTPDLWNEME